VLKWKCDVTKCGVTRCKLVCLVPQYVQTVKAKQSKVVTKQVKAEASIPIKYVRLK